MGDTLNKTYLLVSEKKWHDRLFQNLTHLTDYKWHHINSKEGFSPGQISALNPHMIFIPHWSYMISPMIFENYECIVFHMTDLPFGRGGSPLQNLIVRGFDETMVSALKVEKGIDTGPIYLKEPLSLHGTAEEIFVRASGVIEKMIVNIIADDIKPVPQQGEIIEFRRRQPEESNIQNLTEIKKVYDQIRMLDCEGYPNAYLESDFFKFEFTRASIVNGEYIQANVRITKK